jgi:cobalt-zinc-cadmium efflux system membrane fusion protein
VKAPSRRAVWGAAVALGAVVVVSAARFTPAGPAEAAEDHGTSVDGQSITIAAGAPQWRYVKLGTVSEAVTHWTEPIPARVAIDETRASRVGSPLPGRITSVSVELGERVGGGQPLFSVASPDLAEMRAARERAVVDDEAARRSLDRIQAMVASRALPEKEEAAALQVSRQAELARRLAESKLRSLQVSSPSDNAFTVRAPRSGVVVEKNVLLDQQVSPDAGSALVVVADLSSVWVVADLFEAQAVDVVEGTGAEVTSPSLPGLTLRGTVERVYSVLDPVRHTIPVRVRLANPQGRLRPNVYARVRFESVPLANTLEVPASALVSDGERQYVYLQDGDRHYVRREVVTGPARGGRVAVISGLTRGDTIVEEGAILLDNQIALVRGD